MPFLHIYTWQCFKRIKNRGIIFKRHLFKKERINIIKNFEDPLLNIQMLIVSLKAGSVSINLIYAHHVILYDYWWNDTVERQAINRFHRIRKKKKYCYSLFTCKKFY